MTSESRRPGVEYRLVVLLATLAMSIAEFRRFSCRRFSVMADSAAGGTPGSVSMGMVLRVMMRSILRVMNDGRFRSSGRLRISGRSGMTSLSSKKVQLAVSSNRTRLTGFAMELSWLQVELFEVRLLAMEFRPLLRLSWQPLKVVVSDEGTFSVSIVLLLRRRSGLSSKNSIIDIWDPKSAGSLDGSLHAVAFEAAIALCLLFFNPTSTALWRNSWCW